jgi:hypothetical protein
VPNKKKHWLTVCLHISFRDSHGIHCISREFRESQQQIEDQVLSFITDYLLIKYPCPQSRIEVLANGTEKYSRSHANITQTRVALAPLSPETIRILIQPVTLIKKHLEFQSSIRVESTMTITCQGETNQIAESVRVGRHGGKLSRGRGGGRRVRIQ